MIPSFLRYFTQILQRAEDTREPNAPVVEEPEAEVVLEPTSIEKVKTIEKVGVWVGSSSFKDPARDVAFAVKHNINRFDIIVNDHSAKRTPIAFDVWNVDKIARLAKMAQDAGIEVHLMSWIMPHATYLHGAAKELIPLAHGINAKSVQWDAEEPWTQAKSRMPYPKAAELVAELFQQRKFQMGVNGIGYAPEDKLGPLAAVCDYVVPQAYATKSSGLDPRDAPGRFYRRWYSKFKRPVVMGLAAYRQSGIPGYTPRQAVLEAVAATRAIGEVDTIIYWSLRHIRSSSEVARAISTILEPPEVA